MSLIFGDDLTSAIPIGGHKRKAGRKKFRETRHPVHRGVRQRNGNKWVCEVREPRKKARIWLGTYSTPEMAACAHDVAAIALRGNSAKLNFPNSAWMLPSVRSTCSEEIRVVAAQAAESFRPHVNICAPGKKETRGGKPGSSNVGGGRVPSTDTPTTKTKTCGDQVSATVEETCFVDEEELFNMPMLLCSMAEAMMLSPPSVQDSNRDENCNMDFWLWND